jgi:hypothetical protein
VVTSAYLPNSGPCRRSPSPPTSISLVLLTMPVVQFASFSSLVQPSFWHELTNLKIDVLRLSDAQLTVNASYAAGRSIRDRETGADVALGCPLSIGGDAFNTDAGQ